MKRVPIIFIFFMIITSYFCSASETPDQKETPTKNETPAITSLTFYGHSAFEIITPGGHVLMIDPWLKNPVNPNAKDGNDPLNSITRLDYILVTHAHFDHVGDAVELSKSTGARLVTNFELGGNMERLLGFPKLNMRFKHLMNIGGEITIANEEVLIAMTPAIHSSGMENPFKNRNQSAFVYGGNPAGFVIKIKNGPTIYHAGDTAYFKDMEVIGEQYAPDVALLPIGGHFVMEPYMAAKAAAAVKAKLAIPMHYATLPVLEQKPDKFITALKETNIAFQIMKPGETLRFAGTELQK